VRKYLLAGYCSAGRILIKRKEALKYDAVYKQTEANLARHKIIVCFFGLILSAEGIHARATMK